MARRRRIPYDPPANRKRGRRSRLPLGADQLFLSRRMFLVKGAVTAAFTALAAKLGHMQVIQRDEFQAVARQNTNVTQRIAAPRGLIYDRAGRPLATNKTAYQVRIVVEALPDEGTPERQRVRNALISELGLPDALVLNPNAIPAAEREATYARVAELRGRVGDQIKTSVEATKVAANANYLVLLEDALSIDAAAKYREETRRLPGLLVMNILDYQLGNASQRERVVVKTDVPREIALKIEANRLYLPGVEIDNSVLVREYPAGPVVSHLLGYVGLVDPTKLEEEKEASGERKYVIDDIVGKDGLELTRDDDLRGRKGLRTVMQDAHGVELGLVPGTDEVPPVPGQSLKLTVDLELQAAASRALRGAARFSKLDREENKNTKNKIWPKSGAVVALDPRSGEVLALVSYPSYDNRHFIDGVSQAKWEELNADGGERPYFNRAIASSQPPGSTLKLFNAAVALEEGTITPESTFSCKGAISIPLTEDISKGDEWPCWIETPGGHKDLNVYEAMMKSCDIFFYNLCTPGTPLEGSKENLYYFDYDKTAGKVVSIDKHYFKGLGIKKLHKQLTDQFWFGQRTELDLPGEEPGVAPNPDWLFQERGEYWSAGTTINTAIGQGFFETTPLQLAVNTAALANGGTIFRPRLVKEVVPPSAAADATPASAADGAPRELVGEATKADHLRKLKIKREHLDVVRDAAFRVVNDPNGSANHALRNDTNESITKWPLTNPDGTEDTILVAGKTGTAEVGQPNQDGKYDNQHAWFTCFAPYDEPEIVVTALLEFGGEGANFAVPIADAVLRAYFETTGKRPRGTVLRKDKTPVSDTDPDPKGWLPKPGSTHSAVED